MKYTLLVLVLALSSCSYVLKKVYGIKNPKVENETSVMKYLDKVGMKTDNVLSYNFEAWKKSMNRKPSIPEAYIFNSNGEYLPYGSEYACNASAFTFIENLKLNFPYEFDEALHIDSLTMGLCDLKGNLASNLLTPDVDFYIFLTWTIYSGKLNKDHVKIWEDQATSNSQASLKVIKVNLDFQEYWGADNLAKLE